MTSHWALSGLNLDEYIEKFVAGSEQYPLLSQVMQHWLAQPLPTPWSHCVNNKAELSFVHEIDGRNLGTHPHHFAMLGLSDVFYGLNCAVTDVGRRREWVKRKFLKHQQSEAAREIALWQGPFPFDASLSLIDFKGPIPEHWWVHAETGQIIHEDPHQVIDEMVVALRRFTNMLCDHWEPHQNEAPIPQEFKRRHDFTQSSVRKIFDVPGAPQIRTRHPILSKNSYGLRSSHYVPPDHSSLNHSKSSLATLAEQEEDQRPRKKSLFFAKNLNESLAFGKKNGEIVNDIPTDLKPTRPKQSRGHGNKSPYEGPNPARSNRSKSNSVKHVNDKYNTQYKSLAPPFNSTSEEVKDNLIVTKLDAHDAEKPVHATEPMHPFQEPAHLIPERPGTCLPPLRSANNGADPRRVQRDPRAGDKKKARSKSRSGYQSKRKSAHANAGQVCSLPPLPPVKPPGKRSPRELKIEAQMKELKNRPIPGMTVPTYKTDFTKYTKVREDRSLHQNFPRPLNRDANTKDRAREASQLAQHYGYSRAAQMMSRRR